MMKHFLITFFLFCCLFSEAQKAPYSSSNTKAIRSFEEARKHYDANQDVRAIAEAKNALSF